MVELIWEARGVTRSVAGVVTAQELDSSALQIQGDERIDDLRYLIQDFVAIDDAIVSVDEIEIMAYRGSVALRNNFRIKIAFVGNHPVVHQMIDAFNHSGCSRHKAYRFDNLKDARSFAGA